MATPFHTTESVHAPSSVFVFEYPFVFQSTVYLSTLVTFVCIKSFYFTSIHVMTKESFSFVPQMESIPDIQLPLLLVVGGGGSKYLLTNYKQVETICRLWYSMLD